jgi:hypothetical protein
MGGYLLLLLLLLLLLTLKDGMEGVVAYFSLPSRNSSSWSDQSNRKLKSGYILHDSDDDHIP